ncbi:myelin transcription factor 1 [Fagus crenata]
MQGDSVFSLSPSFNSYSSEKFSEIAARVVEEFRLESDPESNIFNYDSQNPPPLQPPQPKTSNTTTTQPQQQQQQDKDNHNEKHEYEDVNEDDFEFAFVCKEPNTSLISADEIFYNGQIRPIYPLFDQSLLSNHSHIDNTNTTHIRRPPLRKLMIEEQERDSCSSSEADDLDVIPAGTYCVWAPGGTHAASPSDRCKKSNSTGSSKRWKFRDLLYRSNSDGKDKFVFLTPSKKAEKMNNKTAVMVEAGHNDKRKSFLPYRKEFVGFFTNANGLTRTLQPF